MLIDGYGRVISYLRISLTDRCDLRCRYCIPEGYNEFEKPEHWLSFEDIERIVRQFALLGVSRFRLTGGEPLLRKNVVQLVERLKAIDNVQDLSLSTNGTQLARYAHDLKRAGLNRLNVSLDAVRPKTVREITGADSLQKVMNGLQAAKDAGFEKIKINMVPLQGVNDDQIEDMVRFCIENGFILRLIELMPMGCTGQKLASTSLQPTIKDLSQKFDLQPSSKVYGGGPARYWESRDGSFTLGYITPISQHFCETCNRVRLAVDGTLYMCLGQDYNYELAPLLKEGVSDSELQQAIRNAVNLKPYQHEFTEKPEKIIRIMSVTGG